MECIFCKIAKGDIPSAKIFEDGNVIAFLDINPATKGHCLIMPKEHFETFLDAPTDKIYHLTDITKKIAKAMSQALGNKGYNILVNNSKDAGQIIPHLHFHLIPRYENDRVSLNWKPNKYKEIDKVAEKIKSFL